MKANDVLVELLARIGAASEGAVFFAATELGEWPKGAVAVLKESGLMTQASAAQSVTCDGCERQCFMPVEIATAPGNASRAFVVCDKRDDINRVDVSLTALEQWQTGGEAVAAMLAQKLNIRRAMGTSTQAKQWVVGSLRDKHAAQVVLSGKGVLALEIAGHSVPLADVLSLKGRTLALQRQRLVECVNNPAAGGGTRESAAARRARIAARCTELKVQGHRNFRKIVAAEEDLSVETIKRLLAKARAETRTSSQSRF